MLSNYQTQSTHFPTSITINEKAPFHITAEMQISIDECWKIQQKRCQDKLFDGWLFTVTKHSSEYLEGSFVPYSWYIAWLYSQEIRRQLPLCPLGVSGLTYAQEQILIGRRTATVADYPLAYECVPSGGVDRSAVNGSTIDMVGLLQRELFEEAGITAESILSIQPLGLILDQQNSTLEMCMILEVTPEALSQAKAEPEEYCELVRLQITEMENFLITEENRAIVPLTQHMWHLWRKLSM